MRFSSLLFQFGTVMLHIDDIWVPFLVLERSFPKLPLNYTKSKSCFTVMFSQHLFSQYYARKNSSTYMKEVQFITLLRYTRTMFIWYRTIVELCNGYVDCTYTISSSWPSRAFGLRHGIREGTQLVNAPHYIVPRKELHLQCSASDCTSGS